MKPYYSDEHVTLYHGDCREVTEWLDADVLVTDPPYGIALASGWGGHHGDLKIEGDDTTEARDAALAAWGDRPSLVFGRWSVQRPAATRAVLTWEKGEHVGMGDLRLPWKPNTEEVYVAGRWPDRTCGRGSSVLRHLAVAGTAHGAHLGRSHPTEKPTALMVDLIAACPDGIVADPFAGSGTTLVAAKRLGRKAIGVELEERYCEIAAKRLAQGVLDFGSAS
ncbi:MAG: site-specific DNA-methyltransferase [Microthrixaceae bacterium]|nr:site-specific DNA-methyltransferase [Microthrixaceae bacterium]